MQSRLAALIRCQPHQLTHVPLAGPRLIEFGKVLTDGGGAAAGAEAGRLVGDADGLAGKKCSLVGGSDSESSGSGASMSR